MRVLHLGNLANNSYKLVRFQRRAGIDARLKLFSHQLGTGDDPAWEDPELAGHYPGWIEIADVDSSRIKRRVKHAVDIMFRNASRLDDIDVLHAQCGAPILGQFQAPDRLVSHCVGSDLRELAFERSFLGYLMRRALRKSRIVFFNNVDHIFYLERLGVNGLFLPNPLDLDRYRPRPRPRVRAYRDYDFVIFHPVNLDWTYRGSKRSSTKGNDRLVRAFARFVRDNPKAVLLCLRSGPDVAATIDLVGSLGIAGNVMFLDRLRKDSLRELLHDADLIADQFDIGAFGGVAVEALACGRPLLTYLNADAARRCYGSSPPIFNARTEDEIYAAFVTARSSDLAAKGEAARNWAECHHDWRNVVNDVTQAYAKADLTRETPSQQPHAIGVAG